MCTVLLTLVVPCYNEAARLDVDRFVALSEQMKLLFVDDGSSDGTGAVLESLTAHENIAALTLARNRGKAEAVRMGLLDAIAHGAEVVGFADADLATPPDEILRLAALQRERGIKVVMGSRVMLAGAHIERYALRHYTGRGFATAVVMVLGQRFYDTQCGAKIFRVTPALEATLAEPFLSRWIFDVEMIGRLLAHGYAFEDFAEVPLRTWVDEGGSKLRVRDLMWVGVDLLRIRRDLAKRRG